VILDDAMNLVAAIWDGSRWIDGILLDTTVVTTTESKCFDAAYESVSGDLLVAYGHRPIVEETRYATRSARTGIWTVQQAHSTDSIGTIFRLAPDPVSDTILAGVSEGFIHDIGDPNSDVTGMIWNGSNWTDIAEVDANGAEVRDVAVGWIGTTGQAVLVWTSTDDDGLDWARWSAAARGWRIQPDAPLVTTPPISAIRFAQARTVPNQSRLVLLVVDDENELFALSCNGTTWAAENGGNALSTSLGTTANSPAEPFHMSFRTQ
jgi:hypothetical protein